MAPRQAPALQPPYGAGYTLVGNNSNYGVPGGFIAYGAVVTRYNGTQTIVSRFNWQGLTGQEVPSVPEATTSTQLLIGLLGLAAMGTRRVRRS